MPGKEILKGLKEKILPQRRAEQDKASRASRARKRFVFEEEQYIGDQKKKNRTADGKPEAQGQVRAAEGAAEGTIDTIGQEAARTELRLGRTASFDANDPGANYILEFSSAQIRGTELYPEVSRLDFIAWQRSLEKEVLKRGKILRNNQNKL